MRLIDDWRKGYKMSSVQIMALLSVFNTLPLVWGAFLTSVSPLTWALINVVLSFAAMGARFVYQPKLRGRNGDDES